MKHTLANALTKDEVLEIARQVGYKLPYHVTNTDNSIDFGISVVGIYPGTDANVTHDQVQQEIVKSLKNIAAGDFEEVELD